MAICTVSDGLVGETGAVEVRTLYWSFEFRKRPRCSGEGCVLGVPRAPQRLSSAQGLSRASEQGFFLGSLSLGSLVPGLVSLRVSVPGLRERESRQPWGPAWELRKPLSPELREKLNR